MKETRVITHIRHLKHTVQQDNDIGFQLYNNIRHEKHNHCTEIDVQILPETCGRTVPCLASSVKYQIHIWPAKFPRVRTPFLAIYQSHTLKTEYI